MLKFPKLTTIDNFTIQESQGVLKVADRVEQNLDLLAFTRCRDGGLAKFNLVNGVADGYKDTTGINTFASTLYVYDAVNDLISPDTAGIDTYTKLLLQMDSVDSGLKTAIYFDGSGDTLDVADSPDWDVAGNPFTIEAWVKMDSIGTTGTIFNRNQGSPQYYLCVHSTGYALWQSNDGGSTRWNIQGTTLFIAGRWYHVAGVSTGTAQYLFVNGKSEGTPTSYSSPLTAYAVGVRMGTDSSGTQPLAGFLREIRFSTVARYSTNFTPTISGYTVDSNTKLYIKGNEAAGAVTFTDYETSPKTVTTGGNVVSKYTSDYRETTFVDSETTAKIVSSSGNVKQIPYMLNKSAGFFNGTTDYVVVPASTDFNFGTGDYSIEAYINFTSLAGTANCLFDIGTAGANTGLDIHFSSTTATVWSMGTTYTFAFAAVINTWYWVQLVRASGVLKLYVDGVQKGSNQSDTTNVTTAAVSMIGRVDAYNYYFTGWIKELRVSNIARTIAIPTTQFTSDSSTLLLMHFDTPATCPIGPAIYFDGTGDYLTVPSSTDFDLADFTIEAWFKWDVTTGNQALITRNHATTNGFAIFTNSSTIYGQLHNASPVAVTWSKTAGKWYHIAFTRSGSNLNLWVDGTSIGTGSNGVAISDNHDVWIGQDDVLNGYFNGSMREIRISNIARYTTAFTPSQTGFTVDANTKLYIKGNENNGAVTFLDSSTSPKTVSTVGDTKIKYTEDYRSCIFLDSSTGTTKRPYPQGSAKVDFVSAFGTGAGFFDGTNSQLAIPNHADWSMGTADYTIDTYIKFKALVVAAGVITTCNTNTSSFQVDVGNATAPNFTIHVTQAGSIRISYTFAPILDSWYHLAVSRYSGTTTIYLNGTAVGTPYAGSDNITAGTSPFYIGGDVINNQYYFKGQLDGVRISKGIARYTAVFNPPSSAFAGIQNMTLVSTAVTAAVQPNYMRLVIHEDDVDAITPNTDILAYVSRDGGTSYNQVILTDAGTYEGTKRILSGVAPVVNQPAGVSPTYKIVTANNKNLKLYGAELNWG